MPKRQIVKNVRAMLLRSFVKLELGGRLRSPGGRLRPQSERINMNVHETNQQLAADLKTVMRDAEDLLKATTSEAGEKVREVRSRLTSALDSAKATCEKLQDKTVQAAKATDQVIRQHPYESIGIAFGVGLLIGVLVSRR